MKKRNSKNFYFIHVGGHTWEYAISLPYCCTATKLCILTTNFSQGWGKKKYQEQSGLGCQKIHFIRIVRKIRRETKIWLLLVIDDHIFLVCY
jgi:hypothetical protein